MKESYFRRVASVGVGAIAGALMVAGPVHAAPTPEPTPSVEAQALGTATLQQDEFTLDEFREGVRLKVDGTGFRPHSDITTRVFHTATGAAVTGTGIPIIDKNGSFSGLELRVQGHAEVDSALVGEYTISFVSLFDKDKKVAEDVTFTVTDGDTPASDPAADDSWTFLMGDNMAVGFDYLYDHYGLVAVEGTNLDPEGQYTVQVAKDENFESIGIDREIVADEFGSVYNDANIVGLMSIEKDAIGTYFVRVLDGSGELIGGVWTFEVVGGDQEPTPMEDPAVEIDPTVVTHFAYDSMCSSADSGREYTPGETYTWVACNDLDEPIAGTEIKIFETFDGELSKLEQGSLVETVVTNDAGEFQMTVAADGYVGAISSVSPGVRVIVGQAPTAGAPAEDPAPAEESSTDEPAGQSADADEVAPKGLPSTGV